MALFNFFKPKWQHPDYKKRMEAVKKLTDQQLLFEIAILDKSSEVRQEAIKTITDQKKLAVIAKRYDNQTERLEAVKKLIDQDLNAYLARTDKSREIREKALENIKDQRIIADIVRSHLTENPDSDFGLNLITDINVLVDIAKQGNYWALNKICYRLSDNNEIQEAYKEISKEGNSKSRINAISNINDDSFLETIAQTDDNIEVRLKATEYINKALSTKLCK